MELRVLKFEGRHGAEDALNEVIDTEGVRNPWLLEVGVVARPLLGRVRIGVTFPDGKSTTFHEVTPPLALVESTELRAEQLVELIGLDVGGPVEPNVHARRSDACAVHRR